MKRMKILMALVVIICLGVFTYGCGAPREPSGDNKVVAKINNYSMTTEDFRDAARAVRGTKAQVLDELITKNVLVQEAQKENFDKDEAFMKEIQGYWEQALLKLLIKKKTAEFSAAFKADKEKTEEALKRWVNDLRSRAKIKIYDKNLEEIKIP
ncbi:MAG: hypothetical protein WC522_02330 [Candidatus Omnitrophota bacterium]